MPSELGSGLIILGLTPSDQSFKSTVLVGGSFARSCHQRATMLEIRMQEKRSMNTTDCFASVAYLEISFFPIFNEPGADGDASAQLSSSRPLRRLEHDSMIKNFHQHDMKIRDTWLHVVTSSWLTCT